MSKGITLILSVFLLAAVANAAIDKDLVTELVNFTNLAASPFKLYSGMLNIGDNKSIHYIFSAAPEAIRATAPLVLWSNGGPGCSSVEGWLYENGPYVYIGGSATVNNSANPFTWNNVANLLYLEFPVGVGFSQGPANATSNDSTTTDEAIAALTQFFAGFTEYNANPFFISGESYAGIYVPNLAARIVEQNLAGKSKINLKGIMVGNPVTNTTYLESGRGTVDYFHYRYLIPDEAYDGFVQNCGGDQSTPVCNYWNNVVADLTSNINPYNIYGYCYYSNSDPAANVSETYTVRQRKPWYRFGDDSNSPCTTTLGASLLLNNPTAQQQLHVPNIKWAGCSDQVFAKYVRDPAGSIPAYQTLMKNHVSITVFSGDADAVVPFTDTLYWITNLNLNITEQWRAWALPLQQVGGFTQSYAGPAANTTGLRFVTIRGAGHMVPEDKPQSAYILLQSVLNNSTLPNF